MTLVRVKSEHDSFHCVVLSYRQMGPTCGGVTQNPKFKYELEVFIIQARHVMSGKLMDWLTLICTKNAYVAVQSEIKELQNCSFMCQHKPVIIYIFSVFYYLCKHT
jgi:hypothetical protein